jgi:hypothetical protein
LRELGVFEAFYVASRQPLRGFYELQDLVVLCPDYEVLGKRLAQMFLEFPERTLPNSNELRVVLWVIPAKTFIQVPAG